MQLVARLALDGKLPASLVVERATADDSAAVRIAILDTVFDECTALAARAARSLLGDADRDVRYEAFEALVRAGGADAVDAIAGSDDAPEDEARIMMMRWTRAPVRTRLGNRAFMCARRDARACKNASLRQLRQWSSVRATSRRWREPRARRQRRCRARPRVHPTRRRLRATDSATTLVALALREGGDNLDPLRPRPARGQRARPRRTAARRLPRAVRAARRSSKRPMLEDSCMAIAAT